MHTQTLDCVHTSALQQQSRPQSIHPWLQYCQVDGKLKTSNPDVYAVGDIAAYPLKRYGITTRQEHVVNARQTGAQAISALLAPNETEDYNYMPYFYSRVFDLGWQVNGLP